MTQPIQTNTQTSALALDAFPGQKLERTLEEFRAVVDRKQEVPSAREEIPREQVEKAAEKLNRLMGIIDKRLAFSVDERSHQIVVKIIEQETGNVLDEIPPKRILDMLSSLHQLVGLMVDKWA